MPASSSCPWHAPAVPYCRAGLVGPRTPAASAGPLEALPQSCVVHRPDPHWTVYAVFGPFSLQCHEHAIYHLCSPLSCRMSRVKGKGSRTPRACPPYWAQCLQSIITKPLPGVFRGLVWHCFIRVVSKVINHLRGVLTHPFGNSTHVCRSHLQCIWRWPKHW